MGIKFLRKAIRRFSPDAETIVSSLSQFKSRTIAVDSMIFAYKARATRTPVDEYFSAMARDMHSHGIECVFVWDGKPLSLKDAEIGRRRKRSAEMDERQSERVALATEELETLKHEVAIKRLDFASICLKKRRISELESVVSKPSRASMVPTKDDKVNAMRVVAEAGFKNVMAEHEGEAHAAKFVQDGLAVTVLSEDMDVLPFGGNLLTGYSPLSTKKPLLHYNLASVLTGMGMSRKQFVEYCILCGSDLCIPTIRGVGMVNAYNLMKKHGSC